MSQLKDVLKTLSGLDSVQFDQEFAVMLEKHGCSLADLNLETLREILAEEVQDVLLQLKRSVD